MIFIIIINRNYDCWPFAKSIVITQTTMELLGIFQTIRIKIMFETYLEDEKGLQITLFVIYPKTNYYSKLENYIFKCCFFYHYYY